MRNKGFGLLEVLISLLVISVGVAGIVGLQKQMRKKSAEAEEHLIAARLVQQEFEKKRIYDKNNFSSIVVSGASSTTKNGISFNITTSNPVSVAIPTSSGISTDNQLQKLIVDVKWSSLNQAESKAVEFKAELSPLTTFKSNELFNKLGGSSSLPLKVSQDPSNPLHKPPTYVPGATYYAGDQMMYPDQDGKKYVCTEKSRCRDHATYEPREGNEATADTAWSECPAGVCPSV